MPHISEMNNSSAPCASAALTPVFFFVERRGANMFNETYICEKRPMKETYICEKRSMDVPHISEMNNTCVPCASAGLTPVFFRETRRQNVR